MPPKEKPIDKILMLSDEESSLKERPRVRFRRALFSLFIILVLTAVIYVATPLSRLGVIYFEGLNALTRSELVSLIELEEDGLFLTIRLNNVRDNIRQHPVVNQVYVSRSWINRLHILVIEYEVGACAEVDSEMFHILTDGTMLHESEGMRANCDEMMIHGLSPAEVDAGVPNLFVGQLMLVDSEIRDLIQMIEYAPKYGDIHRFSLSLIDGNTVKITTHTMVDQLELYLRSTLEFLEPGQTGILHLDVGNVFKQSE